MSDMGSVIIPKSDQLNADDLITGPLTITVTGVTIRSGQEQPISIHFEGDNGKPYKACKSMCRVMVNAWGADSKKYVGRSMTLYRDPSVKWAGMEVGGIRISHMSDIDSTLTMALTATKQSRKPFTVKPLVQGAKKAEPPSAGPSGAYLPLPAAATDGSAPSADEALLIKAEEFASCGTERYKAWWLSITEAQRKAIGEARHATFKQIAAEQA